MLTVKATLTQSDTTVPAHYSTITTRVLNYDCLFVGWNPSLSSYCSSNQNEMYKSFRATGTTSWPFLLHGWLHTHMVWTIAQSTTGDPPWLNFSSPCCGTCNAYVSTAQLYHWPSLTSHGNLTSMVTSFVDTNGYTLCVFPLHCHFSG